MIKVAFNQHLYKYRQSCPGEAQIPANPSEGALPAAGINMHKTFSMKH